MSDDVLDQLFVGEIISQGTYCLEAAAGVDTALGQRSVNGVYRELHSVLAHAGNVSKLLWPDHVKNREKAARMTKRAQRVLAVLKLSNSTEQVLRDRSLRNHLEHFDERFDDWAARAPEGIVDRNVGPREEFGRFPDEAWLRNYDPSRQEFTFGSDVFDVGAILAAITDVRTRAIAAQSSSRATPNTRSDGGTSHVG